MKSEGILPTDVFLQFLLKDVTNYFYFQIFLYSTDLTVGWHNNLLHVFNNIKV